jgi:hypothetical protein
MKSCEAKRGRTWETGVSNSGRFCLVHYPLTEDQKQVTTFPVISSSYEPINAGVLAYMRERHRGHVYDLVLSEFENSGLTKAALARRLGKAPEAISRWLGVPGNWTLDTVSDLLFSIRGAEPYYGVQYLFDMQNYVTQDPTTRWQQGVVIDAAPRNIDGNMIYVMFDVTRSTYGIVTSPDKIEQTYV